MKRLISGLVALGAVGGWLSNAQVARSEDVGEIVNIAARGVFVPMGFDDNDEVVVTLDGYLPNSCYKVVEALVTSDLATKTITIQQQAKYVGGTCLMALVPYTTSVKLGVLPEGEFKIVSNRGNMTEPLKVERSANAGPDDFLYAPVDNVYIQRIQGGGTVATIEGRFTNTCMRWKEHKIFYTGRTIQLLPIIEVGDQNCEEREVQFSQVIPIADLQPGRYLLHVRSLNGLSLNNVFPIFEHGDPIWN